jgi:branched-chain amino acid transport system ATP-binding protein
MTNPTSPATDKMIVVHEASRRFAGLVAVNQVSFHVDHADALGIIGPNGAGKTTLFNLISGQLPLSSGSITFRDRDIGAMPPHERARMGIGRTFQVTKPMAGMTTLENVMVGSFMRHDNFTAAYDRAYDVLEDVGLAARAKASVAALTLSERRRLEVARALATEPTLILLDEVMAGLNASETSAQIDLIKRLGERGIAFLLIEHNLHVVRSFSRRVVVLDHGIKIAEGTAEEVLANPDVVVAYLGRKRQ